MWVITINGKPATVDEIYHHENATANFAYTRTSAMDLNSYVAYRTKKQAIARYLDFIGYSWKERMSGINIRQY